MRGIEIEKWWDALVHWDMVALVGHDLTEWDKVCCFGVVLSYRKYFS